MPLNLLDPEEIRDKIKFEFEKAMVKYEVDNSLFLRLPLVKEDIPDDIVDHTPRLMSHGNIDPLDALIVKSALGLVVPMSAISGKLRITGVNDIKIIFNAPVKGFPNVYIECPGDITDIISLTENSQGISVMYNIKVLGTKHTTPVDVALKPFTNFVHELVMYILSRNVINRQSFGNSDLKYIKYIFDTVLSVIDDTYPIEELLNNLV